MVWKFTQVCAPLVAAVMWAAPATAGSFTFSYGGRLADSNDEAIAGPVNLTLNFYQTSTGGAPIPVSPVTFTGVNLNDGVFQVDVTQLLPAELNTVFSSTGDTWVEVTDTTHGVTYPRQHMTAIPFALKVPVDGATVTFNSSGQLSLVNPPGTVANSLVQLDSSSRLPAVDGSQVTGVMATGFTGKLAGDVSGAQTSTTVTKIQGQPVAGIAATSGQVLTWIGGQWTPATPAVGSGSPGSGPVSLSQAGSVTGTLAVANGGTGSSTALANNRLMLSSGGAIVEAPALGSGQLFIGSAGAAPVAATPSQGATQGVTLTAGAGSLTLDTAQDIRTSATPQFAGLKVASPAIGSVVKVGTGGSLAAAAAADVTSALGYTPVNKAGDAMTGSLGIGTTSATTTLDIAGALTERGIGAPAVAPMGQGRLYFDSTASQFMVSQNGGAYTALATGGTISGVTPGAGMTGGGTSGNVTLGLTNVGTPGTYTKVQTDANGRVTSGTSLTAADLPNFSAALVTSGTLLSSVIPPLAASQITSGTLPVANGGTGSSTTLGNNRLMQSAGGSIVEAPALSNGQLFIGSTGNAPAAATLSQGGTQGVTFATGAGSLTLDTVQDIRSSATPLFSGLKLSNPAVGSLVKVGMGGTLTAAAAADVDAALSYTPVNKAGDTMTGTLIVNGGNFGVGLTTPVNKLDVNGSAAIGTYAGTAGPSNGLIVSGSVGIGTTTPVYTLDARGPSGMMGLTSTTGTNAAAMAFTNGGASAILGVEGSSGNTLVGGAGSYATVLNGSAPIQLATNGTIAMTIANNGNIGIGTTAPGATLQVNGSMAGRLTKVSSSGTYNVAAADHVIAVTVTGVTVDLPTCNPSSSGRMLVVIATPPSGYPATVSPNGGNLNGSTGTLSLSTSGASSRFICDGSGSNWFSY